MAMEQRFAGDPGSVSSSGASSSQNTSQSKQRRARVSRACDECRARKTKCDGRQPCGNCDAFERYCSYHLNQGRLGTVQRSKILEDRLRRAHGHIRDLQQQLPTSAHVDPDALFGFPPEVKDQTADAETEETEESGDDLDSMMDSVGTITARDKNRSAAFYGAGSGFAFLAKTRELLENSTRSSPTRQDNVNAEVGEHIHSVITRLFDEPLPDKQALNSEGPVGLLLPSRGTASGLLRIVFEEVYPLFQFVDRQAFQYRIDRLHDREPYEFEAEDHVFLPLFYVVMGLGMLFSRRAHRDLGCAKAVAQAMRYFIASRHMLDITRCHHLASLQTLICFALFLMSTARLATAHTYVGIAVSAALKMGLHCVNAEDDPFTAKETEMRRRVLWTITKLDIYISSILGLPTIFNPLEAETTSQLVIDKVVARMRKDHGEDPEYYPLMCATRHLELMRITAKMVNTLYQSQAEIVPGKTRLRMLRISRSKIYNLESELQEWRKRTVELIQNEKNDVQAKVIKYDLEMSDGFARIILYRPFLHYLASHRTETVHEHQLRCAYHCIMASHEVIHRSEAMLQQGYLGPASWHSMYTIFMAVVAMIFYLASQHDNPEAQKVRYDVEMGVRVLGSTTCQDTGSEKCLQVLQVLTERLSRRINLDIHRIRQSAKDMGDHVHAKDPKEQNQDRRTRGDTQPRRQPQQPPQQADPHQMYGIESSSSDDTIRQFNRQQNFPQQQQANPPQYNSGITERGMPSSDDAFQGIGAVTDAEMDPAGHLEAMQIPFAETFGWTMSQGPSNYQGPTGHAPVPSPTIPSSQFPIALEDIDEFFFDTS